jgi:hypothetical protein
MIFACVRLILSMLVNAGLQFLKIAGLKSSAQMFGSVGSPATVTARVQRELRDSTHCRYGVHC